LIWIVSRSAPRRQGLKTLGLGGRAIFACPCRLAAAANLTIRQRLDAYLLYMLIALIAVIAVVTALA
jgi:hypothetical protein